VTRDEALRAQLPHTLRATNLRGAGEPYRGKVRDCYARGDRIVMVTTDRLSAFDVVLTTVPFKGAVLNGLTAFWFERTRDVAPNHLIDVPDPNVLVVRRLEPVPVEVVVRGYLTGSLWRDVQAGRGTRHYGFDLPPGMKKDQKLEHPLLTPSTKANLGKHDEPLAPEHIVGGGLCTHREWAQMSALALALFDAGQRQARERGLILVDTKYEFGRDPAGKLLVMDEIHTPDSSRYWHAEGYEDRFARGEDQRMLDKEFLRQWLIRERGWQGEGEPPAIPDEVRVQLAGRYCDLHELLTGRAPPLEVGDAHARIERALAGKGLFARA